MEIAVLIYVTDFYFIFSRKYLTDLDIFASQLEFLAEDETIEIVPNMRMDPLDMTCVCFSTHYAYIWVLCNLGLQMNRAICKQLELPVIWLIYRALSAKNQARALRYWMRWAWAWAWLFGLDSSGLVLNEPSLNTSKLIRLASLYFAWDYTYSHSARIRVLCMGLYLLTGEFVTGCFWAFPSANSYSSTYVACCGFEEKREMHYSTSRVDVSRWVCIGID